MKFDLQHIHPKEAIEAEAARFSARAGVLAGQRSFALKLLIGLTFFAALVLAGAMAWIGTDVELGSSELAMFATKMSYMVFMAFGISIWPMLFLAPTETIDQPVFLALSLICAFLVSALIGLSILVTMGIQSTIELRQISDLEAFALFFHPILSINLVSYALLISCRPLLRELDTVQRSLDQLKTLARSHCTNVREWMGDPDIRDYVHAVARQGRQLIQAEYNMLERTIRTARTEIEQACHDIYIAPLMGNAAAAP